MRLWNKVHSTSATRELAPKDDIGDGGIKLMLYTLIIFRCIAMILLKAGKIEIIVFNSCIFVNNCLRKFLLIGSLPPMSTVVIKCHTLPPPLDDYVINGQPLTILGFASGRKLSFCKKKKNPFRISSIIYYFLLLT